MKGEPRRAPPSSSRSRKSPSKKGEAGEERGGGWVGDAHSKKLFLKKSKRDLSLVPESIIGYHGILKGFISLQET